MLIYVGSYPPGVGVSVFTGGDPSGLRPAPAIAKLPSASFLAAHPRLPVTYAVSELAQGAAHALVAEPGGARAPGGPGRGRGGRGGPGDGHAVRVPAGRRAAAVGVDGGGT